MTTTTDGSPSMVLAYEDDPEAPPFSRTPLPRPLPQLDLPPLPTAIDGTVPDPGSATLDSFAFRYWTTAEALRRVCDFWGQVLPEDAVWHPTVGPKLRVKLDAGIDLNAFYDRRGLEFFHGSAGGIVCFSANSPDVVSHETGHAVLDILSPRLFNAASAEASAFHEAAGDIFAVCAALQLQSLRVKVLAETQGVIDRSSQLSRIAEQLGWAIRQSRPQSVDPDSLRNAANAFVYRNPVMLPFSAPASSLSSAPHSFSRVFSGAFLTGLAGMFRLQDRQDEASLQQVSVDAGRLFVHAAVNCPVVSAYYSQFAAHMLAADAALFNGQYSPVLRAAFVRHGILSLRSVTSLTVQQLAPHLNMVGRNEPAGEETLPEITVSGSDYGIAEDVVCYAPEEEPRFGVASAALDVGSVEPSSSELVATSFLEDLLKQGRVDIGDAGSETAVEAPFRRSTHELIRRDGRLFLVRRLLH
jgi:hypothetical protein